EPIVLWVVGMDPWSASIHRNRPFTFGSCSDPEQRASEAPRMKIGLLRFRASIEIIAIAFSMSTTCAGCGSQPGVTGSDLEDDPAIVFTETGAVRGVLSGDSYAFKGIPYAAPPVDDRRWRAPAPPFAWKGVRDAAQWGNFCIQLVDVGTVGGSEDCLV